MDEKKLKDRVVKFIIDCIVPFVDIVDSASKPSTEEIEHQKQINKAIADGRVNIHYHNGGCLISLIILAGVFFCFKAVSYSYKEYAKSYYKIEHSKAIKPQSNTQIKVQQCGTIQYRCFKSPFSHLGAFRLPSPFSNINQPIARKNVKVIKHKRGNEPKQITTSVVARIKSINQETPKRQIGSCTEQI